MNTGFDLGCLYMAWEVDQSDDYPIYYLFHNYGDMTTVQYEGFHFMDILQMLGEEGWHIVYLDVDRTLEQAYLQRGQ